MKKTALFISSSSLPLFLTLAAAVDGKRPQNQKAPHPLSHAKYRSHLHCPHAELWLTKGPEAAAIELGLDDNGRKLQAKPHSGENGAADGCRDVIGENPLCTFGGICTCEDLVAADGSEGCGGTYATPFGSTVVEEVCARHCGACPGNVATGATPEPAGVERSKYAAGDAGAADHDMGGGLGDDALKCIIGPGSIGGGHQAGFSKGYSTSCPGTPAQESPYMLPLKWSADVENQYMGYGSDDVAYRSKERVFYMLDKNMKRSDIVYQKGVVKGFFAGPCNGEWVPDGCAKDDTSRGVVSTMIHKGGSIYFIDWKRDETNPALPGEADVAKISQCLASHVGVIGTIRPDWFLDKRGDGTDVQYMGTQHVHDGESPKVAKQWRKSSGSHYRVVSMQANAEIRNGTSIHWPLMMDIAGGISGGDDRLTTYRNHTLLSGEDEELFMLVENYLKSGGVCSEIETPPVDVQGENGVRQSSLEVDLSWKSNEVTFSPIWDTHQKEFMAEKEASKSISHVDNHLTVESCFDETTNSMDMSFLFHDVQPADDGLLPWMAVGYRSSDLCAMTPPEGGVTPIILATHASNDAAPELHKTVILPQAQTSNPSAFASMYSLMEPLGDDEAYADAYVDAPMISSDVRVTRSSFMTEDDVSLHFKQAVREGEPKVMNLMYAIGMTPHLGAHIARGCFQIPVTKCSDKDDSGAESMENGADNDAGLGVKSSSDILVLSYGVFGLAIAMVAGMM